MKIFILFLFATLFTPREPELKPIPQVKHCTGYTLIEIGKAIDCHGDTITVNKLSVRDQWKKRK